MRRTHFPQAGGRTRTRLTLDAELRHKLFDLTRPLELCDEQGLVPATVLPSQDPSLDEFLTPEIREEEFERRLRSKGRTYSTAEVLAHLESL